MLVRVGDDYSGGLLIGWLVTNFFDAASRLRRGREQAVNRHGRKFMNRWLEHENDVVETPCDLLNSLACYTRSTCSFASRI